MDRPTSSQLNPAPNGLSIIQGMPSAESGATGQAFSRMVTEVGQPVTDHGMTDQSENSDNQGYLNPEKEWLKGFALQNQTGYKDTPAIPVAIPLENYQVVEHDPENNTFSIYSLTKGVQSTSQNSTDVDTRLNPPIQIPDQDGIGNSSESTAPIAIITPRLKSEHLQQATSPAVQAEEAVDENSSHIEYQRELRKDPAYAKRKTERQRELRKDPDYAERERKRKRELYKDPAYAERERERIRERRKDPAYAERERERQRERQRELRKDPAYAEHQRERKRERERERRKDPVYAKRKRERQRERYQTDPAYAERERERRRKRYQTDPAYAERQRERQKQYRQSVNSAKNSGGLPLTSNLAETTQSSSKNSEGTTPRISVVKLKEYLQSRSPHLSLSEQSAIEGSETGLLPSY